MFFILVVVFTVIVVRLGNRFTSHVSGVGTCTVSAHEHRISDYASHEFQIIEGFYELICRCESVHGIFVGTFHYNMFKSRRNSVNQLRRRYHLSVYMHEGYVDRIVSIERDSACKHLIHYYTQGIYV